jgi:hypothetical protein
MMHNVAWKTDLFHFCLIEDTYGSSSGLLCFCLTHDVAGTQVCSISV